MLILSREPRAERKKRFRVRALQGNHVSYAEVAEADEDLLRHGRELYRVWCRSQPGSGIGSGVEGNLAREREIFLRAAMQLLSAEQESFAGSSTSSPSDVPTPLTTFPEPFDPAAAAHLATAPKPSLRIPDFLHRRATALRALLRTQRAAAAGSASGGGGGYGGGGRPPREEGVRYGWLQKACRVGRFPSARNASKVRS